MAGIAPTVPRPIEIREPSTDRSRGLELPVNRGFGKPGAKKGRTPDEQRSPGVLPFRNVRFFGILRDEARRRAPAYFFVRYIVA
jgi:hypothetical protein